MDRARTTSPTTHTPPARPTPAPPPAPSFEAREDWGKVVPLRAPAEPDAAPREPNTGRVANDDDAAAASPAAVDAVLFELLELVRAAHAQRDDALCSLELARAENRRLLAERQQLTGLVARWQGHVAAVERWADESQRYYEARLDGAEQQLLRTFHEKERALEIADELLASRLWMRRWRRRTLSDELDLLRGLGAEDPDTTRG